MSQGARNLWILGCEIPTSAAVTPPAQSLASRCVIASTAASMALMAILSELLVTSSNACLDSGTVAFLAHQVGRQISSALLKHKIGMCFIAVPLYVMIQPTDPTV